MARATTSRGARSPSAWWRCHERLAVGQPQHRALAAQRLADEKALGLRVVEARSGGTGRIPCSRPRRPRGTPSPRRRRSRRRGSTCRGRPCRRRRSRAPSRARAIVSTTPVLLVEHVGAHAVIGAAELAQRDEVDPHVPLEHADVRVRAHRLEQRALDLAAGDVAGVHDAARAVPALAAEIELAVRRCARTRRRARCSQRTASGRLAHAELDHDVVAEPGARPRACPRRAPRTSRRARARRRCRPARSSSPRRSAARLVTIRPRRARRPQRERKPGDAAAEHEKIRDERHRQLRALHSANSPRRRTLRAIRPSVAAKSRPRRPSRGAVAGRRAATGQQSLHPARAERAAREDPRRPQARRRPGQRQQDQDRRLGRRDRHDRARVEDRTRSTSTRSRRRCA